MANAARATVRQERNAAVDESKHASRLTRALVLLDMNDFAFAEMISAAIGAQLRHFGIEAVESRQQFFQTQRERARRIVMPQVGRILAPASPFSRDAEFFANALRRAFDK